jgi:predicted transcriptional regulator
MQTTEERQPTQITTRVPAPLADRLTAIANAERRSLSNLLVFAVEQFIENYEANLTQGG